MKRTLAAVASLAMAVGLMAVGLSAHALDGYDLSPPDLVSHFTEPAPPDIAVTVAYGDVITAPGALDLTFAREDAETPAVPGLTKSESLTHLAGLSTAAPFEVGWRSTA